MDTTIRDRFITLWEKFCPGAGLPITFEIGEDFGPVQQAPVPKGWKCFVCDLTKVRKGKSLVFDRTTLSCAGALFYLGYDAERSEHFRYFLSSGKPGVVEGERYKKSPELVDELGTCHVFLPVEGKKYLFRRWDQLTGTDNPDVVIFFARPEVLSALFTLANFDRADPDGVVCPFGSGCSSIIHYPRREQQQAHPRAVLGMFDPSARPCVGVDILTFAVPMKRFETMIGDMEESFLVTRTWEKVQRKIARSNALHSD
ncbi:MAG: DUF169 domain-containing protein [Methanoregulaceae archaeon]|nr:DUF169 domain-containing protein [Methanoregulaceae archaeon]